MGFLEKLRNTLLGADYENDDEFFIDEYEEEETDESASKDTKRKEREYTDFSEYRHKRPESRNLAYGTDPKVLNLHSEQKDSIVIVKPKTIQDGPTITDALLKNIACIVNLEGVEHSDAQRIADFIGGTAYALNSDVERVNNDVFVIAPINMNIAKALKEEMKSGSSVLPWVASAVK